MATTARPTMMSSTEVPLPAARGIEYRVICCVYLRDPF